ncbi:GGDEF domain-containing protein [Paenibacillus sp. sgz500958]|uniref:GGDEF domain-containing protein n=1 Tax=Paenibacillus sp. sgz500958 TaxID=3242475 RepID=UPI0036D2439E
MIIEIITSLFANFCILSTLIFLSSKLSKKYIAPNRPISLTVQILAGFLFGIFGIIMMGYSVPVGPDTYANMRYLTIVIIGAYLGSLPAILCAAVLAVSRVIFYEVSYNSISTALILLLGGICCGWIASFPWSRLRKMMVSNALCLVLTFAALYNSLGSLNALMDFLPLQLLISLVAGLLIYYVAESIQRSNEQFDKLEIRATTDYLTGLNNLRQFHRHLEAEASRAERYQESLSLLAIDIDHFKVINDTYGHPAGDEVLKQLAGILNQHSRSYDTVSRNGGEEFAVILPDCPLDEAKRAGERIRAAVENDFFLLPSGKKINITVSVGVACYPDTVPIADAHMLNHRADQELYSAKNSGRNKVSAG